MSMLLKAFLDISIAIDYQTNIDAPNAIRGYLKGGSVDSLAIVDNVR